MDHSVHKTTVYRVVSVALLITLAILMLFPLYWIITGSVKGAKEINARVPSFFPVCPTSDNYVKLFAKPAWTWLLNTVFACGMTMLLTCLCGAMGGYALAKKRFVGRGFIFSLFVCAMALPKQVIMIPLLREMAWLNLHNTLWAVIFPTVGWPFGVFLMKQFSENRAHRRGGRDTHVYRRCVSHDQARRGCAGDLYLHHRLERLFPAADHAQLPA